MLKTKVLTPLEYSGSLYGDYGFAVNGVKSKNGYSTKYGAKKALQRYLLNIK